jgi:hypothetical protein
MNPIRYFSPAQSSWNLAHIIRLMPESHALFAAPEGCTRIIMISAAAKGMTGRFSALALTNADVVNGGVEEKIACAAEEVLRRYAPKVLFIVTSCIADFIGADRSIYLDALRERHPETLILDARMDPINRKSGLPPIVRMQNLFGDAFTRTDADKAVNVLGSFTPPEEGQELLDHLHAHGYGVRHVYRCETLDQLRHMGNSAVNLVVHPSAVPAARDLQARLDMPWVDLTSVSDEEALVSAYDAVCRILGLPPCDISSAKAHCINALDELQKALGNRPLRLDDGYVRRCDRLAGFLAEHDVPVEILFASELPDEVRAALREKDVRVEESDAPECAFAAERFRNPEAVCAGDYAAWASGSRHYALGLTFSSRFGFGGLEHVLCDLMKACQTERPLDDMRHCGTGCFGL